MNSCRELFRAQGLPIFQNRMYSTAEAARNCPTGEISLVQDMKTGLIYNEAFDPELLVYDKDYQNEQANSLAFQNHLDEVASLIQTHLDGKSLVEVGCGKGGFVEKLTSMGFLVTGMDPAYEGDNPSIRPEYFTVDSAVTADGVILRHVLEHIPSPLDFLASIREANGGKGLVYIEVPCLDWILANNSWFDIFYEHVNYFRLCDFKRIFGRVLGAKRTFGGQYLSIVADLASLQIPSSHDSEIYFPKDFTQGALQHASLIKESSRPPCLIWGGASKGVIFSIHMQRLGAKVEALVDINPSKQGKYVAVTGMLVENPVDALSRYSNNLDILVMNSNYLEEVRDFTNEQYNYRTTDL